MLQSFPCAKNVGMGICSVALLPWKCNTIMSFMWFFLFFSLFSWYLIWEVLNSTVRNYFFHYFPSYRFFCSFYKYLSGTLIVSLCGDSSDSVLSNFPGRYRMILTSNRMFLSITSQVRTYAAYDLAVAVLSLVNIKCSLSTNITNCFCNPAQNFNRESNLKVSM